MSVACGECRWYKLSRWWSHPSPDYGGSGHYTYDEECTHKNDRMFDPVKGEHKGRHIGLWTRNANGDCPDWEEK